MNHLRIIACFVAAVLIAKPIAADVLYVDVDAGGANDGSSWMNAFVDLQSALAAANGGDEIWVAGGSYKPTSGTDRQATFQLVTGVALYGGFAGGELLRTERDWAEHTTVLSGDIGVAGDHSDNSSNVVTGSGVEASAVLDGFTVSHGRSSGLGNDYAGSYGAGMLNLAGNPTIRNVEFSNNDCEVRGCGVYNMSSNPTLENVVFRNNSTPFATGAGGGMCNEAASSVALSNVTFVGNYAWQGGGIFSGQDCSLELVNGLFYKNYADDAGGAIMLSESDRVHLVNTTISRNQSGYYGAGIYALRVAELTLENSIVWENDGHLNAGPGNPDDLFDEISTSQGDMFVSHSIIRFCGGSGVGWDGSLGADLGGNLDIDPLFANSEQGDYRLEFGSLGIDGGDTAALPPAISSDLAGNARVHGMAVDIGPYEFQGVVATNFRSWSEFKELFETKQER